MRCAFCHVDIQESKIGFRDDCPGCRGPLHICRNCAFFDPGAYRGCRERVPEAVTDKERANFCDFFRAAASQAEKSTETVDPGEEARRKLDALFRK